MTVDRDQANSHEVAGEAEEIRAGLAETLDRLRDNLRPENMVAEVVSNARIGASSLADGLYGLARDNPIPAVLIGAGCALLLGAGARILPSRTVVDHDPLDHGSTASRGPEPRAESHPRAVGATSSGSPNGFRRSFTAMPVAARTSADADRAAIGRSGRWHRPLSEIVGDAGARNIMTGASRMDRHDRRQPKSRLSGLFHEQPLIIAALGVAVGAAIGAALPQTRVEDEWMGDASSSVRRAAQDVAQDEIEQVRAVAGRTAENLRKTATDHGLSSDNLNGLVQDAGDHASAAMDELSSAPNARREA